MTLVVSPSSIALSSNITLFKGFYTKWRKAFVKPNSVFIHCNIPQYFPCVVRSTNMIMKNGPFSTLTLIARGTNLNNESCGEESTINYDLGDQVHGDIEDMGMPWEGAIVYRRDPSISHVEYCTTLERLGLGKLSTEISKSRASVMGLRITKDVKDFPLGTPVLISVDVARKKKKLKLDGIIRTVITLGCNRCGEPAAKCIFSNFSLLLTEEPMEEPDVINMGVIFGADRFQTLSSSKEEEEDAEVDLDDQLYFPPEKNEVDISKNLRDMVHVEITIDTLCNPSCKGLCLKCGVNLNTGSCNCSSKQNKNDKSYGPLRDLRKQMQKK